MQGSKLTKYNYQSLKGAFRSIITNEGIHGLFKGIIPAYFKIVPALATSYVTLEFVLTKI